MLTGFSMLLGFATLVLAGGAFFPDLNWPLYAIVPVSVVGLVFGLLSGSRGAALLNLAVIAIGLVQTTSIVGMMI